MGDGQVKLFKHLFWGPKVAFEHGLMETLFNK